MIMLESDSNGGNPGPVPAAETAGSPEGIREKAGVIFVE
jgi:hypothetical protein